MLCNVVAVSPDIDHLMEAVKLCDSIFQTIRTSRSKVHSYSLRCEGVFNSQLYITVRVLSFKKRRKFPS